MKKRKQIKRLKTKVYEKNAAFSEVLHRYTEVCERALFWEGHANRLEHRVHDLTEQLESKSDD